MYSRVLSMLIFGFISPYFVLSCQLPLFLLLSLVYLLFFRFVSLLVSSTLYPSPRFCLFCRFSIRLLSSTTFVLQPASPLHFSSFFLSFPGLPSTFLPSVQHRILHPTNTIFHATLFFLLNFSSYFRSFLDIFLL